MVLVQLPNCNAITSGAVARGLLRAVAELSLPDL